MRLALGVAALVWSTAALRAAAVETYDVVVYGGTTAGVTAAVQAARMGKSTVLVSPTNHVGGVTASGLGTSDVGDAATIGGLALKFYQSIYQTYHVESATTSSSETFGVQFDFEPHVAEAVFDRMLSEAGAARAVGEALDRQAGVVKSGSRIIELRTKSGRRFASTVFIDATYEGDLLAAAGVSYQLGRESREQYHESLAGVYHDDFLVGEVDPYYIPGDPTSGLLPGVSALDPGIEGAGDRRIQQYNFRLCLTNVAANRIPITRPVNYDRGNYELLRRRLLQNPGFSLGDVVKVQAIPGGKTDINANGSFSTDMAGDDSTRWPEASDEERAAIAQHYHDYTQGLFWFLVHDPGVPLHIRLQAAQWGLAADEFTDNDHWPWQLYVREARRMVGSYLITQHDCDGEVVANDPVALGSYGLDSHKVTLFVDATGQLNTDGYFFKNVKPYPISYRALVPRIAECSNLLVPICLSATHVAFNSLRMEPVYLMLGQAAGTAAALAVDRGVAVQSLNYAALARQLRADGQILSVTPAHALLRGAAVDQPDVRTTPAEARSRYPAP